MRRPVLTGPGPRLTLYATTAADLMTLSPVSLRADATVREAVSLLVDKGFSAAPVIDEAGRPVGVLSRSDVVVHDRETVRYAHPVSAYYEATDLRAPSGENLGAGFQVEEVDPTLVRDIMTPVVFSVAPDTPARTVVSEMLALKVHRLFVIDHEGVLVGLISALDLLRHLA